MGKQNEISIRQATADDLSLVKFIVHDTIGKIYPLYYPQGAVDFFLAHHREENIASDLSQSLVYVLSERQVVVGVVTVKENEIKLLFVLSEHQSKGYGGILLDFAEAKLADQYDFIRLDSSWPAKTIYLKRGYRVCQYHTIRTDNGDYLCYDVMTKEIRAGNSTDEAAVVLSEVPS